MATALDIIKASLRAIRVIDADETPSASESATALFALNAILKQKASQPGYVYQFAEISHTLTPGDGSYTVGVGNDIPYNIIKVGQAFIRQNNTDIEVSVWPESQYQSIPNKTSGGTPSVLFLDRNIAVRLWPVPSQAGTLRLIALVPFDTLALSDTIVYPPEYEQWLRYELAFDLVDEYGGTWTPTLQSKLTDARSAVEAMNVSQQLAEANFDLPARRSSDVWFVKRWFPW